MYSKEEQQFLDLRSKFVNELAEIDTKLNALEERRALLMDILAGVTVSEIAEELEEPVLITLDEGALRTAIEKDVLATVKSVPGTKYSDVVELFASYDADEVRRAITRLKNRKQIRSEGTGRASRLFLGRGK